MAFYTHSVKFEAVQHPGMFLHCAAAAEGGTPFCEVCGCDDGPFLLRARGGVEGRRLCKEEGEEEEEEKEEED